jgi:hypothetical protein
MVSDLRPGLAIIDSVERPISNSRIIIGNLIYLTSASASAKVSVETKTKGFLSAKPAPAQLLPPEILSRIFTFVNFCSGTTGRRGFLFLLSFVCARWRQVVLGDRLLWSHIDLELQRFSNGRGSGLLNSIRLHLERSQGATLHLHFHKLYFIGPNQVSCIVSMLQPHAGQLKSLQFSSRCKDYLVQALLGLCARSGSPGSLKSLAVSEIMEHHPSDAQIVWSLNAFPGLAHLRLENLHTSAYPTLAQLASMLSTSPSLQTIRLRNIDIPDRSNYGPTSIALPNLKLLDLDMPPQAILDLLPILYPGTLKLALRLQLQTDHRQLSVTQSLFDRSNVVSLYLGDRDMIDNGAALARYLSWVPQLRVLFLDCTDDVNYAQLDALTVDTNGGCLARCPNLEVLCLKDKLS